MADANEITINIDGQSVLLKDYMNHVIQSLARRGVIEAKQLSNLRVYKVEAAVTGVSLIFFDVYCNCGCGAVFEGSMPGAMASENNVLVALQTAHLLNQHCQLLDNPPKLTEGDEEKPEISYPTTTDGEPIN